MTWFINTELCYVSFKSYMTFIMDISSNWTAYILKACHVFSIYAVQLLYIRGAIQNKPEWFDFLKTMIALKIFATQNIEVDLFLTFS